MEKIRILGEKYAVNKNHEHDTHSASNELLSKCSLTILCLKILFVKEIRNVNYIFGIHQGNDFQYTPQKQWDC